MKIIYEKVTDTTTPEYKSMKCVWGSAAYKFKINNSILKTHFKLLMRISKRYDSKEKSGFFIENETESFLNLIEKIEKSKDNQCNKSHLKSIESCKTKRSERKISCDHSDLGSFGYKHGDIVSCPLWQESRSLVIQ